MIYSTKDVRRHLNTIVRKPALIPVLFVFSVCMSQGQIARAQDIKDTLKSKVTNDSLSGEKGKINKVDTLPHPQGATVPHVYKVNGWFSGTFSLVATAADIYAIPKIIKSKPDLTDQELEGLNPNGVPAFDRWALRQDPSRRNSYYNASDHTLPAVIISAGVLAFDRSIRKDWARLLLMYYEMHAITFSIYNFSFFGPAFQNKYRPIVYYDYFSYDQRRGGNQRNSMYSGHVATAAASTFFMVKVYSDYHPELGGKKYILYALATLPPLLVGYQRVKALAHFPSDVMVGLVIGAVCGVTVPELHRFKTHNVHFGVTYNQMGGPGISMVWNPEKGAQKLLKTFSRLNDK